MMRFFQNLCSSNQNAAAVETVRRQPAQTAEQKAKIDAVFAKHLPHTANKKGTAKERFEANKQKAQAEKAAKAERQAKNRRKFNY